MGVMAYMGGVSGVGGGMDELRRQRDEARALEGEVARLRERIGELEASEVELRSDLAEAERELRMVGEALPREIAKRLKAYSARTAGATQAEHLDAVTAIDERLGEVLRAVVERGDRS